MGLCAARFCAGRLRGHPAPPPPAETAMGALYHHVTRPRAPNEPFEPMNINFGLLPPLPGKPARKERRRLYATRARDAFAAWA